MNRSSGMQNGLIDPVTLTFDLSTSKALHFKYIPRSFPIPSLNTWDHLFLSYAADKQTNVSPTPTDIVGVGEDNKLH